MFWAWLRVNLTRTARWLWEGHKTYLCPWTQTILLFGEQKSPFLPVKCATMRDKVIRMVSCARNGQNDLRTQGTMGKTTPLSASGPFQSRANMRHVLAWCEPQLKAPILLFYRGKCNQKRKQKCISKKQLLFIIFYSNFIWVRKNVMNDVDK